MSGYTKLFSEILTSSVWQTSMATRILWITMLALKDMHGFVAASVPGLAHTARIDRDDCETALAELCGPDPDSRTPDNDGRRIAKVDGGWVVLNHELYRGKTSSNKETMQAKERMRRFRSRQSEADPSLELEDRNVTAKPVTACNAVVVVESVPIDNSKGDSKSNHGEDCLIDTAETLNLPPSTPETLQTPPTPLKSKPRSAATPPTEEELAIYKAYPKKTGKPSALRAIRTALTKCPFDELIDAVREYGFARSFVKDPAERRKFTKHPQGWFNDERWNDDRATWYEKGFAPSDRARTEEIEELNRRISDFDTPLDEIDSLRVRRDALRDG